MTVRPQPEVALLTEIQCTEHEPRYSLSTVSMPGYHLILRVNVKMYVLKRKNRIILWEGSSHSL